MFEDSIQKRPDDTPLRRLLKWCLGPWSRKRFERMAIAIIGAYLIFAFITLWSPPLRGVVVDAKTGEAISSAEIRVRPTGFFFPAIESSQAVLYGRETASCTDAKGRYFVPGSAARAVPGRAGILDVFSPIQWLTHVQVAVWAPGYGANVIEIPSYAVVPWWRQTNDKERWQARRLRLPVLGFWVHLALRKPEGEQEWRRLCGQAVTAHAEGIIPDEWLFNDLTGYLERWPQGEKAATYFDALRPTCALGSCDYLHELWSRREITRRELATKCDRGKVILSIYDHLRFPQDEPSLIAKDREQSMSTLRATIPCAEALLLGATNH